MGALIRPLFKGLGEYKDLPQASSLCGACYEACPVKINIPKHLINLRRDIVKQHINSRPERLVYWAWGQSFESAVMDRDGLQFHEGGLRGGRKGAAWGRK